MLIRDGMCCTADDPLHIRTVPLYDIDGPEGEAWCAAACAGEPLCSFFAFAGGRQPNRCELCSGCALVHWPMARSWPRNWTGCMRRSIPTLIGGMLSEFLQTKYSIALYRRPGAVRFRDLRMLFADLLPRAGLRALADVGVCKAEAAPPYHPFYWGHDIYANPRNSIWIHRTEGPQPLADNAWVEVTHCAFPQGVNRGTTYPLWTYVAPGSGVSINVGRTMVASSYAHATRMLREAFAKADLSGPSDTVTNVDGAAVPTAVGSALASYDSLQIVNHREYHSIEARHEIVLLKLREESSFTLRTAGLMCGRHPHLFHCAERDLWRLDNCTSRPSASLPSTNGMLTEGNVRQVFRHHRRCNASHSAVCYQDHVERYGDYFCCDDP